MDKMSQELTEKETTGKFWKIPLDLLKVVKSADAVLLFMELQYLHDSLLARNKNSQCIIKNNRTTISEITSFSVKKIRNLEKKLEELKFINVIYEHKYNERHITINTKYVKNLLKNSSNEDSPSSKKDFLTSRKLTPLKLRAPIKINKIKLDNTTKWQCAKKGKEVDQKGTYKDIDIIDNNNILSKDNKKALPLKKKKLILKKSIPLHKKKIIITLHKKDEDDQNGQKIVVLKKYPKIILEKNIQEVVVVKKNNPKIIINKPCNLDDMSADGFKKDKDNGRKPKYTYTFKDHQLYKSLVKEGALKHIAKKDGFMSKSYFTTMNYIHEMLDPSLRNTYFGSKIVNNEYKAKIWDMDEIIETFRYYMSIVDKTKILYKNVAHFIFSSYNCTKSWSPLVKFHIEMLKDFGVSLEGDTKKLHSELERLQVGKHFDARSISRIVRLLDVICEGYKPNPSFKHLYFNSLIYMFSEFVEQKLRIRTFKPGYIVSEKIIQEFFDEYASKNLLIQG